MGKLVRATQNRCSKCQYRMRTSHGGNGYCCNYLTIMNESRIFRDGVTVYDPKYCDKYEKGKQILRRWQSDDMTWKVEVAEDGEEENSQPGA